MLLGRVSTDRLQDPSGWIVIIEQQHTPKITSALVSTVALGTAAARK